jgi:carboxymethylenebutenolidase
VVEIAPIPVAPQDGRIMTAAWVSILVEGHDMCTYVSQPEGAANVPGVIVSMEACGVNQHIQEVTDRLSREGYVAVAPVLYHRKHPKA